MLSLTDDQLATVMNAAEPLLPADRSRFLQAVATALDGQEIGDGVVARTCREIQSRYFHPPARRRPRPATCRCRTATWSIS